MNERYVAITRSQNHVDMLDVLITMRKTKCEMKSQFCNNLPQAISFLCFHLECLQAAVSFCFMFSIASGLQGFLDAAAVQPVSLAARDAFESCIFLSCRFEVLLALQPEHIGPTVGKHVPLISWVQRPLHRRDNLEGYMASQCECTWGSGHGWVV